MIEDNKNLFSPTVPNSITIKLKNHPLYSKYFSMLKFGCPKVAVQQKMEMSNVDPHILELNEDLELTDDELKALLIENKLTNQLNNDKDNKSATNNSNSVRDGDHHHIHRKKIFLTGINVDRPCLVNNTSVGSLWKSSNDDHETVWKPLLLLDTSDEFKKLFIFNNKENAFNNNHINNNYTDNYTDNNNNDNQTGDNNDTVLNKRMIGKKVVHVIENLIEYKRVHNISIFLTKIKMKYSVLAEKINSFDDSSLSYETLQLLIHCLPTPNEIELIENYIKKNSVESISKLGNVEVFMYHIMKIMNAKQRIESMIFKQQFRTIINDFTNQIHMIDIVCKKIKNSKNLKKILQLILEVTNELSGNEKHVGLKLESLLLLHITKAYDLKTTILDYIIILLYRFDKDIVLSCPEDLIVTINTILKIDLDVIIQDMEALHKSYNQCKDFISQVYDNNYYKNDKKSVTNSGAKSIVESTTTSITSTSSTTTTSSTSITTTIETDSLHEDLHPPTLVEIYNFYHVDIIIPLNLLKVKMEKIRHSYMALVDYFGEDTTIKSHEFFSYLYKFLQEFIIARDKLIVRNRTNNVIT